MAEYNKISIVEKLISKLEGLGRRFLRAIIPPNGIGAEIGVHRGGFAAELISNVQPRKIHLLGFLAIARMARKRSTQASS